MSFIFYSNNYRGNNFCNLLRHVSFSAKEHFVSKKEVKILVHTFIKYWSVLSLQRVGTLTQSQERGDYIRICLKMTQTVP